MHFPIAFMQDFSGDGASAAAAGLGIVMTLFMLAFAVLMIAAMWKVFDKAGEPGWAAIVPIYNIVVLLKISGKPIWWIVLFMIPFVNFIAMILVAMALAESFGKSTGFALGLVLLPFIFYPLLAWGDGNYRGAPAAATA